MKNPLPVAISPCPNDTFVFHAWISGIVGKELQPHVTFADIETLNQWATKQEFPLIKMSFNCFGKIFPAYRVLPVGAALGYNCGPKIIAPQHFEWKDIKKKRIAIPGYLTTAHLLLDLLLAKPYEKIMVPYDQIMATIRSGRADCGLIIHESRFTFLQEKFVEIVDLGELWHQVTQLPLPLGCLGIRQDLDPTSLIEILQGSLQYAWKNPQESAHFISKHAQEKVSSVVEQHIALYVNQNTFNLSKEAILAIDLFFHCASKMGLYSQPKNWLATI